MSAQTPLLSKISAFVLFIFCSAFISQAATVNIQPGDNIPNIVNQNPGGTTFIIYPGTYRLTTPIVPKSGDSFIGQTACAPPKTACSAILNGSVVIGPEATFNGTTYQVTGQTQQGAIYVTTKMCQPNWLGCIYPEDLYFDGVPLQHLYSSTMPAIASGQFWFDYNNATIYFHDNPAGHTVETSVASAAFDGMANNVTISQLTLTKFATPVNAGTVGMLQNPTMTLGTNWTVKNCEISLNHGTGVRIAVGMQILNNYIHNNGDLGVAGGLSSDATTRDTPSGILVSGNTITYNNYAHVLADYGSGGIKITSATGVVIRGNTITNNDGSALHFDMSASSPIVENNTVTNNYTGGGIEYEVSLNSAIIRNNIMLRNGVNQPGDAPDSNTDLGSHASTGVNAYCNVIDMVNAPSANGVMFNASNRGYNPFPPYQYLTSTGNSFHHNTLFWDAGSVAVVGYWQSDAAHQPNFFEDNTPPDYNMYHLPSLSLANFTYDNNNSQRNSRKTFAAYQEAGADVHGTADTNTNSGFPTVKITSPATESSVGTSSTIQASATDPSGIEKVEFFVDWTLKSTVTSSPYTFDWASAPAGSHVVTAMAYSKAGIGACYAITLNVQ
jgi:parallel beta-helix repeat protein